MTMQAPRSQRGASVIREQLWTCAFLPDAELISAGREYLGCERIASDMRKGAVREQNRLLPQLINLPAKTREGVAMKARVIAALFANTSGIRGAVVRSLADDVAAVMGEKRS